jgi:mRNA-degrading endonuclease YafQ of YafQ-DinJ toxin-antitoxin module
MVTKPIYRSEDYLRQVNPANPQRIRGPALNRLKEFLATKRNDLQMPFGGSDSKFVANAPLGRAVPGLRHAHITQDYSIVYKVDGGSLYLYGVYSHNDLGTGNASKEKTQQQMATRFANMKFRE